MKKIALLFSCTLFVLQIFAQLPESEVWLFDYNAKTTMVNMLSGINISNNPGYDNQPFFAVDSKSLLWTSQRDSGQTDIFSYSIPDKLSLRLTQTSVSEYSPEFIPGSHYFSCVVVEKDSTQRLWRYNLNKNDTSSKPSELMFPEIKNVAYSRWFRKDMVYLCILPEPMHLDVIVQKEGKVLQQEKLTAYGGRSMQACCVKRKKWFFYTEMKNDSTFFIHGNQPGSKHFISPAIPCPSGSQDFTVDRNGHILMAKGTKIYSWTIGKSTEWKELCDMKNAGMHKITRMMISPDGKHIAVVDNLP
jgi:hypothetical protein